MDPLTHTLVGANLGATRISAKTRLATAACVIGANLPDVDVTAYFVGEDFATGFRRGWTHGMLALVVLPMLLWLVLLAWDRLRRRKSDEAPALDRRWLLFICYVATLTHPFLDWLNVYGMRWLMPFDSSWFYGDAVFIMDPWLWLVLGGAWLLPRSPTRGLVLTWLVLSSLLALVVWGRAPHYLPLIGVIAAVLLGALLWRPRTVSSNRFGWLGLGLAAIYIGSMIGLHHATAARVSGELDSRGMVVRELMVGPLPVDSLRWDVLAQMDDHYRFGVWDWKSSKLSLAETRLPRPDESALWKAAVTDPSVAGYVSWVRYPWMATVDEEGGTRVFILDARYMRRPDRGFGGESVLVGSPLEKSE